MLVTLLPLKSSKMDGAAMVLDDNTPVIGLSAAVTGWMATSSPCSTRWLTSVSDTLKAGSDG